MSEAPAHYLAGGIETIDYIRAKLTPEGFIGYLEGNILKYQSRWRHKGGLRDLHKAQEYLGWLIAAQGAQETEGRCFAVKGGHLFDLSGGNERDLGQIPCQAPELTDEEAARIYADSDDNVGDLKAGEAHG